MSRYGPLPLSNAPLAVISTRDQGALVFAQGVSESLNSGQFPGEEEARGTLQDALPQPAPTSRTAVTHSCYHLQENPLGTGTSEWKVLRSIHSHLQPRNRHCHRW